MADNTAEIARLKKVIDGAITSTTVDGQTVHMDLDHAKRRLAELTATDDTVGGGPVRRPVSSTLWLGN